MILAALPWTGGLLIAATLLAFGLGTLLGALMAWSGSPRPLNYLVPPLLTLSAVLCYLLRLVLVYLFAVTLKIFPFSGGYTAGTLPSLTLPFVVDTLSHSVLPGLSIVLAAVGIWTLGMRGMTNEDEDYMVMAQAKCLPSHQSVHSAASPASTRARSNPPPPDASCR